MNFASFVSKTVGKAKCYSLVTVCIDMYYKKIKSIMQQAHRLLFILIQKYYSINLATQKQLFNIT